MPTEYGHIAQRRMETEAAQMADALLRVPILTRTQLAQYAAVHPMRVKRLLERYAGYFAQRRYVGSVHHAATFGANTHGTQYLVELTSAGRKHFATGTQTPWSRATPANRVGRVLALGDVLVAFRKGGLIGDTWDIRTPHERHVSVHAWIMHEGVHEPVIGLFRLPHQGPVWSGKRSVLRGYIDRTIQHVEVAHLLFLCPNVHYQRALGQLVDMAAGTQAVHLLPIESFLQNPAFFLDAIRVPEQALTLHLLMVPPKRCMAAPLEQSGYGALIQDQAGMYKLVDWWNDGSIRAVQAWMSTSAEQVYLIPDDSDKVASGWVYVADDTMRRALSHVLSAHGSLAQAYAAQAAYLETDNHDASRS